VNSTLLPAIVLSSLAGLLISVLAFMASVPWYVTLPVSLLIGILIGFGALPDQK
jgi:hypothetical protein